MNARGRATCVCVALGLILYAVAAPAASAASAAGARPMSTFRAMRTISRMSRSLQLAIARLRYPEEYVEVYTDPPAGAADRLRAAGIDVRVDEDGAAFVRHEDQESARLIASGLTESAGPYIPPPIVVDWSR